MVFSTSTEYTTRNFDSTTASALKYLQVAIIWSFVGSERKR